MYSNFMGREDGEATEFAAVSPALETLVGHFINTTQHITIIYLPGDILAKVASANGLGVGSFKSLPLGLDGVEGPPPAPDPFCPYGLHLRRLVGR